MGYSLFAAAKGTTNALERPTMAGCAKRRKERTPSARSDRELLRRAVKVLRPQRVTIVVTERPFAPAIAASRGEQPGDVEAWLAELTDSLAGHNVEFSPSCSIPTATSSRSTARRSSRKPRFEMLSKNGSNFI